MTEYRAVLFDMDGVLVDTEPHWNRLWRERVFPEVDGEPSLEDVTGRSYPESLRDLDDEYGFQRDVAYYEELLEDRAASLYVEEAEGEAAVHVLFDAVRDRDLAVGVVSSSPRPWIEGVVDRFGLGPLDVLCSAAQIEGPGKPAPDVYEHAATELGLDPDDCVVVEDSANGVRAAATAGATVIQFEVSGDTQRVPEATARAGDPDDLAATLFDLVDGESAP